VTHPFHPLFERRFALVEYRCSWRERRVWFHNDAGVLSSLPVSWTSVEGSDPVVAAGGGNSPFRVRDLLSLARLIHEIRDRGVT
jgi:hypothetical protein